MVRLPYLSPEKINAYAGVLYERLLVGTCTLARSQAVKWTVAVEDFSFSLERDDI